MSTIPPIKQELNNAILAMSAKGRLDLDEKGKIKTATNLFKRGLYKTTNTPEKLERTLERLATLFSNDKEALLENPELRREAIKAVTIYQNKLGLANNEKIQNILQQLREPEIRKEKQYESLTKSITNNKTQLDLLFLRIVPESDKENLLRQKESLETLKINLYADLSNLENLQTKKSNSFIEKEKQKIERKINNTENLIANKYRPELVAIKNKIVDLNKQIEEEFEKQKNSSELSFDAFSPLRGELRELLETIERIDPRESGFLVAREERNWQVKVDELVALHDARNRGS